MLTDIIDTVVDALCAAEIPAMCAWPKTAVEREENFICVSIACAEDCTGGLARYLGVENDAETGSHEVYGMQCAITLRLDIFASLREENPAGVCLQMFDAAAETISALPGLRVRALRCEAPEPDRESGMFRLRAAADCTALLLAYDSGGAGEFTDFVLRGELQQ